MSKTKSGQERKASIHNLLHLMDDMLARIATHLELDVLLQFSHVNKRLHATLNKPQFDKTLWGPLLEAYFPKHSVGQLEEKNPHQNAFRSSFLNLISAVKKKSGVFSIEAMEKASPKLKADKALISTLVRQNGYVLRYASVALKNDASVVTIAITQNGLALKLASATLQNNHAIVLAAVKQNGRALVYASAALRSRKAFVMKAVQLDAWALGSASTALRNDYDVVLTAVRQNASSLQDASRTLRANKNIIRVAIEQDKRSICFALPQPYIKNILNSQDTQHKTKSPQPPKT